LEASYEQIQQVSYEQARRKVPEPEAELLEKRATLAAGVANTPQALMLTFNFWGHIEQSASYR